MINNDTPYFLGMIMLTIIIIMVGLDSIIQDKRINELEIQMQEQQLLDQIGKQMLASRLNINIR
jgi:hypothetical protein